MGHKVKPEAGLDLEVYVCVFVWVKKERATVQYGQILFNFVSYSSLKIQSFLR